MLNFLLGDAEIPVFDSIRDDAATGNTSDILVPEVWIAEALYQVSETRVASQLIWTDMSEDIARFGQVIHTYRPANMRATRKRDKQKFKVSKAASVGVDIKLDQWVQQAFVIYDAEASLGFTKLIETHLKPAAESIAQFIDEVVCSQVYRYLGVSEAGSLDAPMTKATIIHTRRKLEKAKVDPDGMFFLVGPDSKAQILSIDGLTKVNEAGDGGRALRKAEIGELFGFLFFMTQNVPSVEEMTAVITTAAVDTAHAKGVTSVDIDGLGAVPIVAGAWLKFTGEGAPRRVIAVTALAAGAQTVTLSQKTTAKLADNAGVSIYPSKATTAEFAKDYIDDIKTAAFDDDIQTGQLVSFGILPGLYGCVGTPEDVALVNDVEEAVDNSIHMTLDIPVQTTIPASELACLGPEGNYNMAFHRNSIAMVSRPPAAPFSGMGVLSDTGSLNGLAMRINMGYDLTAGGIQVNLDTFFGVTVMDDRLGAACFANAD